MRSETDRRFLMAVWHSIHAIRWACALVACVFAGGLLCVVPAEGQAVRDEGFPTKGVFPEEYPDAPGAEEACGPLEVPGAFGEGCVEHSGPDAVGGVSQGAGFSSDPSNPVFRTAPRLECPAAVFVEELETGSIDCHAWDEAGEEHLDYYWEPVEGAPRGYLDAPRLTGEDRPNPSIVAPSSPFYATLESFLSEDATLRYRYRVTATSRVTGLSSYEEVEVFVLLRRPSVYCPLEYEVSAGSEIVLSCEGADPLSFRMDYEAGSSVSWEWEGLWGSNASLLSASDTPSPLFRAPSGGAGETHHYVASMTTTSSGVPRTARRRVSVRVVEGEAAGAAAAGSLSKEASAPTIKCPDYEAYPTAPGFRLKCTVTNEPLGAKYSWTARDGTMDTNMLKGERRLQPTFSMSGYSHRTSMQGNVDYKYRASMLDGLGVEVAYENVTVTVLDHPDLMTCATLEYEAYVGDPDVQLECKAHNLNDPNLSNPAWSWGIVPLAAPRRPYSTFSRAQKYIKGNMRSGKPYFEVPDSLPAGMDEEWFQYEACRLAEINNSDIVDYFLIESEYITVKVKVKKKPEVAVTCEDPDSVYEGAADVALSCKAQGAPSGSSYSYAWTARSAPADTSRLSATNIDSPTFDVPDTVDKDETYEYALTVSADNARNGRAEVAVTVKNKRPVAVTCADPYPAVFEGAPDFALSCTASNAPPGSSYSYAWTVRGSTPDTDLLSATDVASPTFDVPDTVDKDEAYEYLLTVSADNALDDLVEVTVTVLKRFVILSCASPAPVYEGSADITLDCKASGAPGSSPAYTYVWTTRGSTTDTDLLSGTDVASPTFDVPEDVPQTTKYEYRVTASVPNVEDGTKDVTVTVLNKHGIMVACAGNPYSAYEGGADITLDCSAWGLPNGSDYDYAWTARGSTPDTDFLSETDIASPMFAVPEDVPQTTKYEYRVTVSAPNVEDREAEVTVRVLDRPDVVVSCASPGSVYEGSEDVKLSCEATGALDGSSYAFAWAIMGDTPVGMLGALDVSSPMFYVPEEVDETTRYEYKVTATAPGAEDGTADVTVTVLDRPDVVVSCASPGSVYEGSEDVKLSCEATGALDGSSYAFAWAIMGDTPVGMLGALDVSSPMFYVPEEVDETTRYEYKVTATAPGAEDGTADVTVTVLNTGALALVCPNNPWSTYEGEADITLDCLATGASAGSDIAYAWTPLGSTPTGLLNATNISSPTFYVPEDAPQTTTYEYKVTASAPDAEDGTVDVTVTVLNRGALALACDDPDPVYEGASDITLNCLATGAPAGSDIEYLWTPRGATPTGLLNATNISSPTFYVPEDVPQTTTYEYRVTASAPNVEDGTKDVTVTVLNRGALFLACASPAPVYEGSEDITLNCLATGAPAGSDVEYLWTPRGATPTGLLSATNISSPTFYVPEDVSQTTTYEYRVTASAPDAEDGTADATVTVLNTGVLALTCANPAPVYEGSADIALNCSATGAPAGSDVEYLWTPRGATPTGLLSATNISSPTFYVPEDVSQTATYEYRVTASAPDAEDGEADVTVTVLNRGALALTCANPAPVYEGSADIALNCSATGAPAGSDVEYLWTPRGATPTGLLSATNISSPTFYVPEDVSQTATYEYRVTASAPDAEDGEADVTVTVLNRGALALTCANPAPVYEGSADIALNCSATGAPDVSDYAYVWEARGATANTNLLSETNIDSPTFYVPDTVDKDETYEYRVTVSAENAEDAAAEVTVTVLNRDDPPLPPPALAALALTCANPASVYEGSEDIALNCSATGAPDGSAYEYVWEALGATPAGMLSALDIASPTFYVPDEVDETTRYEYGVTVSATNAESAMAEVTVTVLDRPEAPAPPAVAFSGDPTSLGVATSASSLRFGAQPSDAQASLDPLTDQLSTRASGPHHAGRMTLSPDGSLAFDANGELALSIELATPVTLRRITDETASEAGVATLALTPSWSYAASCEQLASEAIGGLHTQTTLSESDCRLLLFGGDLDLSGAAPGRYAGNIDVILRTGAGEETHSVEAEVTVVAAPRVITIGPGGVRFDASRGVPSALTEEQNLSVYPDMAFMTADEPSGAFELSNPSLVPLEVSVSARFGYAEATEDGRETVVEDKDASGFGDLSEIVNIYPRALTLMPGERGVVRYGVREESLSSLSEAGYAAFFEVTSSPRRYAQANRLPEGVVASDETARVTLRIPGAYVPGEIAPRLKATLLSLSGGASPTATFLLETDGVPFAGEAAAYDGEGRALGRSETLTYARSRVRMSLDRLPEGEVVFLRFTPRGSGDAPEPVSVPWDAPRRSGRDIGAAQDSDVSPPNAVFAEKHLTNHP